MDEARFFVDLGLLFLAALGGAATAQLLRQPLIVGYVLAGIVVGPFTPGPRSNTRTSSPCAPILLNALTFRHYRTPT